MSDDDVPDLAMAMTRGDHRPAGRFTADRRLAAEASERERVPDEEEATTVQRPDRTIRRVDRPLQDLTQAKARGERHAPLATLLRTPRTPSATQPEGVDDSVTATVPATRISPDGRQVRLTVPDVAVVEVPDDETEVSTLVDANALAFGPPSPPARGMGGLKSAGGGGSSGPEEQPDVYDFEESVTACGPRVLAFDHDDVTARAVALARGPVAGGLSALHSSPGLVSRSKGVETDAGATHDGEQPRPVSIAANEGKPRRSVPITQTSAHAPNGDPSTVTPGPRPDDSSGTPAALGTSAIAEARDSAETPVMTDAPGPTLGPATASGAPAIELTGPSMARGEGPRARANGLLLDSSGADRAKGLEPVATIAPAFRGPVAPEVSQRDLAGAAAGPKPRYGPVVGLVAVASLATPLILFLWLRSKAVETPARGRAELALDPVGRADPPRPRAAPPGKGAPSSTYGPPVPGTRARGGRSWGQSRK